MAFCNDKPPLQGFLMQNLRAPRGRHTLLLSTIIAIVFHQPLNCRFSAAVSLAAYMLLY